MKKVGYKYKPMPTSRKVALFASILFAIIVTACISRAVFPVEKDIVHTVYFERIQHLSINLGLLDFVVGKDSEFQDVTINSCEVNIWGSWERWLTMSNCKMENSTIYIENMSVKTENCTITNCRIWTDDISNCNIYISNNTFSGHVVFDINVVNEGGCIGLENVVFNGIH